MSLPSPIFDGDTFAAYFDSDGALVLHRSDGGDATTIFSLSPVEWENLTGFVERLKKRGKCAASA